MNLCPVRARTTPEVRHRGRRGRPAGARLNEERLELRQELLRSLEHASGSLIDTGTVSYFIGIWMAA